MGFAAEAVFGRGVASLCVVVALAACMATRPVQAQSSQPYWGSYGGNAQHTALSSVASQPLNRIRWHAPVDLDARYSGADLLVHYGSPLLTQANTVIMPVKLRSVNGFRIYARRGSDGSLLWRQSTNYRLPPHGWTPTFSPVLTPTGKLWFPAGGGAVYYRTAIDARGAGKRQVVFYGADNYRQSRRAYLTHVFINTPLTTDSAGNVFFGFQVTGATPLNLRGGIARIADDGTATWVAASTAAADSGITKVAHNCAPALSNDGSTLYVAVSNGNGSGAASGYLLALNSQTLATIARRRLKDPSSSLDADINDNGTASPTVGPDGDVYFGVLESPWLSNHDRGWLLHFDSALNPKGAPGAFGWDDTASIVPATMVPSYHGSSTYLLMTKYNNYAGAGGDGVNRIAVLDPNAQMLDPISGATVMREVLTIAGPTPDLTERPTFPNAVREWCINTAAIDPMTHAIMANSEDGTLYRWDMTSGTLSQSIVLTGGVGEAYTPTVIGPDGTVYAINNGVLFAIGQ
jgi:hypothetical protein